MVVADLHVHTTNSDGTLELAEVPAVARRAGLDAVEAHLGHEVPVEPERGIGRPDVARAVVASDPAYDDVGSVFDDLIGENGPCYVRRRVPTFERAREVLGEACAVVGLAHPLRYPDPGTALELAADLDAVEVHYPYDGSRGHTAATGSLDTGDVAAVADEHDLLVTGGSDTHERDLGGEGLSADEHERFAAALDG